MDERRHLVENFFQRLNEFRRIATRYDKTDASFAAAIHLVAQALVDLLKGVNFGKRLVRVD